MTCVGAIAVKRNGSHLTMELHVVFVSGRPQSVCLWEAKSGDPEPDALQANNIPGRHRETVSHPMVESMDGVQIPQG